jgi:phosphoglucomutase
MINHVTDKLKRKLYEVPVGFKWFVDGLYHGDLGFGGEESGGAVFSRLNGDVWITDKDGIVSGLLAAEIMASQHQDVGDLYNDLENEFGKIYFAHNNTTATPAQKETLRNISPQQITSTELAGEKIDAILTHAPGDNAPLGGVKVVSKSGWFVVRPSGTENIYEIYAESFQDENHLKRILSEAQIITDAALASETPIEKG